MKVTVLKTTLALVGAALFAAPAAAETVNAVYRSGSSPASLEQVRRIFVAPAYGYDPYYYGQAYYGPSFAYVPPPVAYAPRVAYAYVPPPPSYYYGPGPAVAFAGPRFGVAVGF